MNNFKSILIFLIAFAGLTIITGLEGNAQRKQSNWITEKNDRTGRWRIGFGIDASEPMGVDVQFYRLSKFCTNNFSVIKKLAVGTWVGKEGVIFGSLINNTNNDSWKSGGIRYGIDLKFYIPILFNPYIGIGAEGGTRNLDGKTSFYPDAIARIGIEQKILGVKLSTKSSLNITLFADGKFNYCLTKDFNYFLPGFGARFHFL